MFLDDDHSTEGLNTRIVFDKYFASVYESNIVNTPVYDSKGHSCDLNSSRASLTNVF